MYSLQAGKYNESLKHLEALQEANKEDYKISMNKAIVEFYRSGQATTGTLMQTLMAMKNQVTHCLKKPLVLLLMLMHVVDKGVYLLNPQQAAQLPIAENIDDENEHSFRSGSLIEVPLIRISCCMI